MENGFGKIEFQGKTDVRYLHLDDLIIIKHKSVEVYPDSIYPTEASKPSKGEELNKEAIITFYEVQFKND